MTPREPQGWSRLWNMLDATVWWMLAVLNAFMSLAILVQVLFRIFFRDAIIWAEEFAVLLFAWIIFLGAAYTQKTDSHLSIDTLRNALRGKARTALDAFRLAVIAACSAVAIWQGVKLTLRTIPLLYPTMEISRAFLYAGVPVCFTIGLIYMLADIRARWKESKLRKMQE